MKQALILILMSIMLALSINAAAAYTAVEVEANPYVGVRTIHGEDLVVYPNNSSIVYADAEGPVRTILLEDIYENLSINYVATQDGDTYTTELQTQDTNIAVMNVDGLGKALIINLTQTLTNDSYLEIYVFLDEGDSKTLYVTDATGTTVYGNATLASDATPAQLYTIQLDNVSGEDELYLHDSDQGGAMGIQVDYVGVYEPISIPASEVQAQCDRDNVVKWGVFGSPRAGEERDLFFYCNALNEIHHYDYSTSSIERIPYDQGSITILTFTTTCNFQEVHAVTEDWYVMSCYEQDNDIRYYTLNRTNLSEWYSPESFGSYTWQPGSIAEAFGYDNDEGYMEHSDPIYIEELPNAFFQLVQWRFGASNYARTNLGQVQASGNIFRPWSLYCETNNCSDPDTIQYYAQNMSDGVSSGRQYNQDNGREWCHELNEGQFYCHNGAPIDDVGYKNNILIDLNNGGLSYNLNTALLPNGTQIDIRTVEKQGTNLAYVYDDLDVQLVDGNSVLLEKGGLDLFNSYGLYHAYITRALYYMPTSGSLYKLVGLPSGETLPTTELYSRYTDYEDGTCLDEGTYVFKDQLNDTVITDQGEDCTYIGTDQYGEPYLLVTDESSVRTEYRETENLVKAFDVTDDELHVAYECDYRGKEYDVIDAPDWTEYGDPDTFCTWNQGTYESKVSGLIDNDPESIWSEGTLQTIDTSTCIINFDYTVESNGASTVTYYQEFQMDDETGVTVELLDIYGESIANFTIEQEYIGTPQSQYSKADRFFINGELVHERENNDGDYAYYTHEVELLFKGTELSWRYALRGGDSVSGVATLDADTLPPINVIRYNPLSPGPVFNWPDRDVSIGQLALIRGELYPRWDLGVSERESDDQYRYYEFTCDYTDYEDGLYYLRVYVNDEDTGDYSTFEERVFQIDSNYIEYLAQLEDEILVDEARETEREAKSRAFVCDVFNACDDTSRMFVALLVMGFFVVLSAAYMHKKYEQTLLAQLTPALVGVTWFIFFASIGFLPTWFVVSFIILAVGAGAVVLNPMLWTRGGGGGRY